MLAMLAILLGMGALYIWRVCKGLTVARSLISK
jgi:hypothetical protein